MQTFGSFLLLVFAGDVVCSLALLERGNVRLLVPTRQSPTGRRLRDEAAAIPDMGWLTPFDSNEQHLMNGYYEFPSARFKKSGSHAPDTDQSIKLPSAFRLKRTQGVKLPDDLVELYEAHLGDPVGKLKEERQVLLNEYLVEDSDPEDLKAEKRNLNHAYRLKKASDLGNYFRLRRKKSPGFFDFVIKRANDTLRTSHSFRL